jgi:hypothetical protein
MKRMGLKLGLGYLIARDIGRCWDAERVNNSYIRTAWRPTW